MKKNDDRKRKLVVKTETLRQLGSHELGQVVGGATYRPPYNNCTGRLSGCISLC